jgi:hypothetical protein
MPTTCSTFFRSVQTWQLIHAETLTGLKVRCVAAGACGKLCTVIVDLSIAALKLGFTAVVLHTMFSCTMLPGCHGLISFVACAASVMNEVTWRKVGQWEALHSHECSGPKLLRFQGQPDKRRYGTSLQVMIVAESGV